MPGVIGFVTSSIYFLLPLYVVGLSFITVGLSLCQGLTSVGFTALALTGNVMAIFGIGRILHLKLISLGVFGFMDATMFPIIAMTVSYFVLGETFSFNRLLCLTGILAALIATNLYVK